jgi:hypothetical protein
MSKLGVDTYPILSATFPHANHRLVHRFTHKGDTSSKLKYTANSITYKLFIDYPAITHKLIHIADTQIQAVIL